MSELLKKRIREVIERLESIKDDEQAAILNLPAGLPERLETMEMNVVAIDTAITELEFITND